jgi:flagellin-like protein
MGDRDQYYQNTGDQKRDWLWSSTGEEDDRAVSPVVGTVLLVAVIAIALAALVGSSILGSGSGKNLQTAQVEQELRNFDTQTEDVVQGSVDQTEVEFGLDAGSDNTYNVIEGAGSITVEIGGSTVYQSSLGRISLDQGSTMTGYQSGGVFGKRNISSYPVAWPELSTEDLATPTYTMPVVVVKGTGAPQDTVVVTHTGTSTVYPNREVAGGDTVKITIKSEYASAWGQVFANKFRLDESDISVDADNNKVVAKINHSDSYFFHLTEHRIKVDSY